MGWAMLRESNMGWIILRENNIDWLIFIVILFLAVVLLKGFDRIARPHIHKITKD